MPPPFKPKTWNAEERVNSNRSITTNFTGSWMNRLDRNGNWKTIDLSFTEDSSGFQLNGTPYSFSAPRLASGEIYFEDNVNFDPKTNSEIDEKPFGKLKQFITAKNVPGQITPEGLLYEGAFDFGDLLIQSHQQNVKHLIVLYEKPAGSGDLEIPFIQQYDGAPEVKYMRTNKKVPVGRPLDIGGGVDFIVSAKRSIHTRKAVAWDSAGKFIPILVTAKCVGNVMECKKVIPRSFLNEAVYPVYTDTVDTFTADTADRGITSDGASFASYRSGSSLTLETLNNINLYAVAWAPSTFVGYRSFMWWATGATIPSANTITAASLDVYYHSTHAAITRTTYLVQNRQASDALATSDWSLIGASGVGTGTGQPFASVQRTSGEAAGTKTFTINSNGRSLIAKGSGNTYFMVISAYDWDNSSPPNEDTTGSDFRSSDNGSNRPTLSVTHNAPLIVPSLRINQAVKRSSFY